MVPEERDRTCSNTHRSQADFLEEEEADLGPG